MKVIPDNFADTLRGGAHVPPVLAALGPDLRRALGAPLPDGAGMPEEIAALLVRLGAGEPAEG